MIRSSMSFLLPLRAMAAPEEMDTIMVHPSMIQITMPELQETLPQHSRVNEIFFMNLDVIASSVSR